MFELILAYHPNRLDETHPLVIQDLLELVEESKQLCVNKCVQMMTDLHQSGLKSRYLKPLFGAVYELKDRTSQGGARVYFVVDNKTQFYIAHAECKTENEAVGCSQSALKSFKRLRQIKPFYQNRGQHEKTRDQS